MKTDLNKQIEELKEKHAIKEKAEKALKGMKVLAYPFEWGGKKTININVDLMGEKLGDIEAKIKQIIKAYKPGKNAELSFAGKDNQKTANPFRLNFKNGINDKHAEIQYKSGTNGEIHIKIPVNYYSDDIKGPFTRKVTNCEYHYFGGVSMDRIMKMEILCYRLDMFERVGYFGGDQVHFIINKDDKDEFECVVLRGHIPEFADRFQKSLKAL